MVQNGHHRVFSHLIAIFYHTALEAKEPDSSREKQANYIAHHKQKKVE